MGTSILTLHPGTWFYLTMGEFQAWQSAVFRTYQIRQKRDEQGEAEHLDPYQIAHAPNAALPMEMIYIHRLRLFLPSLQNFDVFYCSSFEEPGSCR